MGKKHDRSLAGQSILTILALLGLVPALVTCAQAPRPQPRRLLSPSVEEIIKLWHEPPQVCSQAPCWFWNGPLDPNTMRQQVRLMTDKGVYGALPPPRLGMDRRLCLEEPFGKAMDATLDEVRKVGSSVWLYDEYNWPRGFDYAFVPCEGPRDFAISKAEPSGLLGPVRPLTSQDRGE